MTNESLQEKIKKDSKHYTFRVTEESGVFRATEPHSSMSTFGRGDSPAEAIMNYCELMSQ